MRKFFFSLATLIILASCAGDKKEKQAGNGKDSTGQTNHKGEEDQKPATKSESVIGRWKPVEMNLKGMDEQEKKDLMAGLTLEFDKDGRFFAHNNENKQEGTYSYDPATQKMTVVNTSRGNDTEHFTISWEKGLLLMTNEEGTVTLERQ